MFDWNAPMPVALHQIEEYQRDAVVGCVLVHIRINHMDIERLAGSSLQESIQFIC